MVTDSQNNGIGGSDKEVRRTFRPNLQLFHPNAKGTGSAVKFELHPAHDDRDGCIMMTLANQKSVGSRTGETPTYSTFDWENRICVKLDFSDLAAMLQVFRGECESIADGHGLYHRSVDFSTKINLHHFVDPRPGYLVEVYRSSNGRSGPEKESNARFLLSSAEAEGLSVAIEHSLAVVCFGIPMVIPHDTSAYRARVKEARNGAAA